MPGSGPGCVCGDVLWLFGRVSAWPPSVRWQDAAVVTSDVACALSSLLCPPARCVLPSVTVVIKGALFSCERLWQVRQRVGVVEVPWEGIRVRSSWRTC